jgi:hypothetical protein
MPIAFLNRARGSESRAFDTDVLSWRDAVVTNGGSVSLARLIVVDQFVFSEKAAGTWALTDDYWGFWAENAAQALTSLKQRRLATAVNTPTFTTDRDYTFDGATSYIDTGFVPSTAGVAYTSTLQRVAVYERTNVTSTGAAAGVSQATNNRVVIVPRSSGANMTAQMNTTVTAPTFTLPASNSQGLSAVSRANSATTILGYKNGARLTDSTGQTATSNIQSVALFIGGNNNSGSLNLGRAAALGFIGIGAPLSDAQELAQYNAVQAWATSVGAQV